MSERSHPPSLFTLAKRAARDECALGPDSIVLCAVSGGPDSMALLHVLAMMVERGLLGAVHAHAIDHGLRAAAKEEIAIAARFAEKLGVAFGTTSLSVAPGANLQARARDARWAALEAARNACRAHAIATGHHADDRAETVLIRLLRGAPAAGLGVLPPRAGVRVRPLLRARRADVEKHLARHAVPFSHDPSNDATRFLRTRVRRELMPLLVEISPGIVEHLCALADELCARTSTDASGIERSGSDVADALEVNPRVESRRTLEALAKLAMQPEKYGRARVLLKGGVVLSAAGAQSPKRRRGAR